MSDDDTKPRRRGIKLFDATDATELFASGIMSMPVATPAADEQMMEWGLSHGHVVKTLFQDGENGPCLVWSWFGPGYTLPRHSHSADCLYYVVKGEAHLGNQVVKAGSGFFVPADAPYAYTAGPDGIEILEFRSTSPFDMKITESLPGWDQVVASVREHDADWAKDPARG
jgi:quercetin dioxygenase-like cupin family protein